MAHTPGNDAFIAAVKVASEALCLPPPKEAIAISIKNEQVVVSLIDVSALDPRDLKVVREVTAYDANNIYRAIKQLLPYQKIGHRLAFLNTWVNSTDMFRWVLFSPENNSVRLVDGGMIISGEYRLCAP